MRKTTHDDVSWLYSATDAVAVTPHDTNEITDADRIVGIYVGVAGDLVCKFGADTITFANCPVGFHPIAPRIITTGTAATNIVALLKRV